MPSEGLAAGLPSVEGFLTAPVEGRTCVLVDGFTVVLVEGFRTAPVEGRTCVLVDGFAVVAVEGRTDVDGLVEGLCTVVLGFLIAEEDDEGRTADDERDTEDDERDTDDDDDERDADDERDDEELTDLVACLFDEEDDFVVDVTLLVCAWASN